MNQNTTEIRLTQSPDEHRDLTRHVEDLCKQLNHHGDEECANWLLELVELLTDVRTDRSDRETLSRDALRHIFPYTTTGKKALEAALLQINPQIAKWKVIRAA